MARENELRFTEGNSAECRTCVHVCPNDAWRLDAAGARALVLLLRLAQEPRAAAACPDPARAAELREIAASCAQLAAGPARTFQEAAASGTWPGRWWGS
jgi:Fe-S-cluster-containing hydrogenase component 2